ARRGSEDRRGVAAPGGGALSSALRGQRKRSATHAETPDDAADDASASPDDTARALCTSARNGHRAARVRRANEPSVPILRDAHFVGRAAACIGLITTSWSA